MSAPALVPGTVEHEVRQTRDELGEALAELIEYMSIHDPVANGDPPTVYVRAVKLAVFRGFLDDDWLDTVEGL